MKRGIDLLNVIEDVTLRHKKILPAVIVEIFQADSPPRASAGKRAQSGLQASITECTVAIIVVDAIELSGKLGDDHVRPAIVVIILKDCAHAREPASVLG